MKTKNNSPSDVEQSVKPEIARKEDPKANPHQADPVSAPSPPMDGKKPVSADAGAVEKFLIATDTNGGD